MVTRKERRNERKRRVETTRRVETNGKKQRTEHKTWNERTEVTHGKEEAKRKEGGNERKGNIELKRKEGHNERKEKLKAITAKISLVRPVRGCCLSTGYALVPPTGKKTFFFFRILSLLPWVLVNF